MRIRRNYDVLVAYPIFRRPRRALGILKVGEIARHFADRVGYRVFRQLARSSCISTIGEVIPTRSRKARISDFPQIAAIARNLEDRPIIGHFEDICDCPTLRWSFRLHCILDIGSMLFGSGGNFAHIGAILLE